MSETPDEINTEETSHDRPQPEPAEADLFGKPPPEGKQDWSHRRAEPRPLALAWTSFLLAATTLSFVRASGGSAISPADYRPHARELMFLIVLGLTVLWPMLRLSQRRPQRGGVDGSPVSLVIKDLIVLLLTTQAMIWPHVYLARFPLDVLSAVAALTVCWGLLTGAMLAVAQRSVEGHGARGFWCAGWVVFLLAGAAWALFDAGLAGGMRTGSGPAAQWLASPLTGVIEILRERPGSGFSAAVGASHWRALTATFVAAALAWVIVAVLALRTPKVARSGPGA